MSAITNSGQSWEFMDGQEGESASGLSWGKLSVEVAPPAHSKVEAFSALAPRVWRRIVLP